MNSLGNIITLPAGNCYGDEWIDYILIGIKN